MRLGHKDVVARQETGTLDCGGVKEAVVLAAACDVAGAQLARFLLRSARICSVVFD
jgi:hypothetical protein